MRRKCGTKELLFFRWLNQWRQAPRGMRRLPLFSLERYSKVTARMRKAEGPDGPTCRGPLPRPASANWEDGRGVRRAPLVAHYWMAESVAPFEFSPFYTFRQSWL
jgi:hypothetical protein